MSPITRRSFLKTGLAAGAIAAGAVPLLAAKRTATDTVVLGRSNVQVTRLAFGTGTNSGAVQAALGQQEFTRLIRYAYDRGIHFFETAEAYTTPGMLGEALKGLPRDSYQLMSKVTTFHQGIDPQAKFDELRRISQTEYFDIMLLHWQHSPTGQRLRNVGRTESLRRSRKKPSARMARLCTGCRRCGRCRAQIGLTWA
jgi:aryl-alcohol dehydrogenase-like predicted oxidoreductase